MECRLRLSLGILCLCFVLGCSQSPSSSETPEANTGGAPSQPIVSSATPAPPSTPSSATPSTSNKPAIEAASNFLEAVIQGDTQRASASLTPRALENIAQSGKQFAPPGLDTAKFRIGQVRMPSPSQALVQCLLTDTTPDGKERQEEMCCLLRLIENQWRVSGIAFSTGPNRPPMIIDFENPERGSAAQQTMAGTSPAKTNSTGRPSPPRTAQETAPPALR